MKARWILTLCTLCSLPLGAAQPPPQPPQPPDKPQLPKSQMPDLGRPTRPNDEQPLFNFDEYFPGTWKFEWDVPEGVLGASGTITGTITYKKIDAAFFEAETKAIGPGGPFTMKETIAYRKEGKTVARSDADSRGDDVGQGAQDGG